MRKLKIYLADLTYTTLSLATDAFPINVGFVAAYAKKIFGDEIDISLFKYIDDLENSIKNSPPDILGMSNYPWNFSLGMNFFELTNRISPHTVKVMGGPNVPLGEDSLGDFLKENRLIDFYTKLEGESAFANIIERAISTGIDKLKMKQSQIDGVISLSDEKEIIAGKNLPRIKNLDEIPSPYLTGLMDKFFDGKLSPMLETTRGCPFTCTYCHEGNEQITKVNFQSLDRVIEDLNYIAGKIPAEVTNLMFADPNFGMYSRDREICEHIAEIQRNQNWPLSIFASIGKNKKKKIAESIKMLNGTMKLWLSVQSMDFTVLREIKRDNIKMQEMFEISNEFESLGIPTCSELILALPGETYKSHIESISKLVESNVDLITTYNLMLLNGTELNSDISRKKYGMNTHFRILPRDFGKMSDGTISVEIEEVVTSTNSLSFEDYLKLRAFHLIINVIYNGKGFKPLFKYFQEKRIPIFELLSGLVENLDNAPGEVKKLVNEFKTDTKNELWNDKKQLLAFINKPSNYDKLLNGIIGANLIQTYISKSMNIMEYWTDYLFQIAHNIINKERFTGDEFVVLENIKSFCLGRVTNILGKKRYQMNPTFSFDYNVRKWLENNELESLSNFKLKKKVKIEFSFQERQKLEMEKYIKRFGQTSTGIGRILTKMDIRNLWRNCLIESEYEN